MKPKEIIVQVQVFNKSMEYKTLIAWPVIWTPWLGVNLGLWRYLEYLKVKCFMRGKYYFFIKNLNIEQYYLKWRIIDLSSKWQLTGNSLSSFVFASNIYDNVISNTNTCVKHIIPQPHNISYPNVTPHMAYPTCHITHDRDTDIDKYNTTHVITNM